MVGKKLSLEQYKTGILQNNRALLGQAITLVESSLEKDKKLAAKLIQTLLPHTGKAFRIGISGVPGVGKSTFIEAIGNYLTRQGKKVAVLAIDPSSKVNGGSILGDKTRMNELAKNDLAFIRPSPSQNLHGGVSGNTYETMLLCEAAGFEYILIETVGVGQSETDVYYLTDLFLLLMIPGMGDELQLMKKGIMELANAIIINKADGENVEPATKLASEISQTLRLFSPDSTKQAVPIRSCSSKTTTGIAEIVQLIDDYMSSLHSSGALTKKRAAQTQYRLFQEINLLLQQDFYNSPDTQKKIKTIENEVTEGKITPNQAAHLLLKNYKTKK